MFKLNLNNTSKWIFVLSFLFLNTLVLNAQNTNTNKQDSIIFNKLEHDYGIIELGSDGQCEFTFTNKGDAPLILSNVRASCGCTVPQWTREPVAPGETGTIKVKYNTKIAGAFNKSITVNSNAVNSNVVLRIKGKVEKSN
ncbi:MAG: DUF1573 domain-containing protein [Mariniphaga sp.]|nr:DUF1573 domain-containing protein [Mariniphaga sp.]MDD4224917.1 DUF1573 domain-containing protein [Mariniphaga sp.]MDD4425791.1 DUF1573 domain-containing protein [Mariniphaga sp.]